MYNPKIVNISDIVSWLYCPRKVYLQKVCGLQTGPNRNMIIGKIKHNIFENVSKNEETLISQVDENSDNLALVFMYEDFIKKTSEKIFFDNAPMIDRFLIDKEDILKKVLRDFSQDIKLRVKSIRDTISKGFTKENIWKNLDSIYVSEVRVESEELQLKGRVDRIIISRKDNSVIPFELKSREDRIFHSDEIQLTAYAMLLEQHYKQAIKTGFVEAGNNRQEVTISEENKSEVLDIANMIRNINENPVPPMQSNFNKCKNCEFREECAKL